MVAVFEHSLEFQVYPRVLRHRDHRCRSIVSIGPWFGSKAFWYSGAFGE